VGRSNWAGDTYSKGSIAGLYAVDALLSEAEISDISDKMYRGGDILQSCQTCYGDSTSLQGSLSTADCQCQAGAYKSSSEADKRAISLVSGRAQFSTLANRNLVLYKPTAVFDSTGGPGGIGAVTFDRSLSQFIDAGAHTFNIASNGGFTAVAVVKFTGVLSASERVLDFRNGQNIDNIILSRWGVSNSFVFQIRNVASNREIYSATGVLVQDIWLPVVVTYKSSDRSMGLRVGCSVAIPVVCETARVDRSVSVTNTGKSQWVVAAFENVSIAGLYAVDALLSEAEISEISRRMYLGVDTLQACHTCAGNTSSLQRSLSEADCECAPGTYKSVSEADQKAISLDSWSTQLSTMANRGLVLFTDTAVFNSTAGPTGSKGAVTFNRTLSQHIDGGTDTFNIASNGGSQPWFWSNSLVRLVLGNESLIFLTFQVKTISYFRDPLRLQNYFGKSTMWILSVKSVRLLLRLYKIPGFLSSPYIDQLAKPWN